jgi:hypothetical protein
MIEQCHYEEARRLIADEGVCEERSEAYCEGMTYGIAWHLAGLPKMPGRDRFAACPYERATAENETWQHAFSYAKTLLIHWGLHTSPGPLIEVNRPHGGGWIYAVEPRPGMAAYEYQITDTDGEIEVQSNDAYGSPEVALYAALKREIEG